MAALAVVLGLSASAGALASVGSGSFPSLSGGRVAADSAGASSRVIVILRNQRTSSSAPNGAGFLNTEAAQQAPLQNAVRASGGQVTHRYSVLNAFAATVAPGERASLAADPSVASVIPDDAVHLQRPLAEPGVTSGPAASSSPAGICPSKPANPILEPEALSLTHTEFGDASLPQAHQLATGRGVKVAFIADALDTHNADFTRADGSPVFFDYRDFTGNGLNAPTNAIEAFLDASSLAAQGRVAHDLSTFVNPAHPLPPGCTIKVRGVAPDASLADMVVFDQNGSSFNSEILQGLDWAVNVDHVDIVSQSFGDNPIPDSTNDLIRQFNEQAAAAGVTVVASSGDASSRNTIGSPASDPAVIDVGASTQFRSYAQTTANGFQLSGGNWVSDNISSISSGGITQQGHTLDLVAPGDLGWIVCNPNVALYSGCVNYHGTGSPFYLSGGTSESAPLTSGAAALVIQAYRDTHAGQTPSPALVKQILTSSADDLGLPSNEQGSGRLNTLAAVQAARSLSTSAGTPVPNGNGLLVGPTQLDFSGPAGSSADQTLTVTNVGSGTQTIHAQGRSLNQTLSDQRGTVNLNVNTDPLFIDQRGAKRAYQTLAFGVPIGADRLDASIAWARSDATVRLALIDPLGNYTAYSLPQGTGNFGHVDVRRPAFGTWKAILFTAGRSPAGFSGPVQYELTTSRFGEVNDVSPPTLTLAQGASGTLHVHAALPAAPGDHSQDIVLDNRFGGRTVVPVVLRSLVPLGDAGGAFAGTLTGGNGRFGGPAEWDTFSFDVPAGKPQLGIGVSFSGRPATEVVGYLVDPNGDLVSQTDTVITDAHGTATITPSLQAYARAPQAGRWQLTLERLNPSGGASVSTPYSGQISFAEPPVAESGVPKGSTLPAGTPHTATIKVTNTGVAPEAVFVDPRLGASSEYPLVATSPAQNLPLPNLTLTSDGQPHFRVPTETTKVFAAAEATEPVTFDFSPDTKAFASAPNRDDPDIAATSAGDTAAATYSSSLVPPGPWVIFPDPLGPFASAPPPGKVSVGMSAVTRTFDASVASSTGDLWLSTVKAGAPATMPLTLLPGQSGTITVRFTPVGARGRVVTGQLFVDDYSNTMATGDELVAIPYGYKIG